MPPIQLVSRPKLTVLLKYLPTLLNPVQAMSTKEEKHCTMLDFEGFSDKFERPSQSKRTPSSGQLCQSDGTSHMHDSFSTRKRKASPLSEDTRKIIKGNPKSLGLPQISESENSSRSLIVRHESPWDTYRRTLRCKLAGDVFIAARRSRPSQVVAIREYTKEDKDKMQQRYGNLDHPNVLSARECFMDGSSMYALVDDLPLTLEQLVGCRSLYPTEAELASIVWQVCHASRYRSENLLIGVDFGWSVLSQ